MPSPADPPLRVILDTDLGGDIDDLGVFICNDLELFEETRGENEVFDDGCNTFHTRPDGLHRCIRPRVSPQELAHGIIEPLMLVERWETSP